MLDYKYKVLFFILLVITVLQLSSCGENANQKNVEQSNKNFSDVNDASEEDDIFSSYTSNYRIIDKDEPLPIITLSNEKFESLITELETIFDSSCYQFDISFYKEKYGIEGLRKSIKDKNKFYCKYVNKTENEYIYILFNQKNKKLYDWNCLHIKKVNGEFKILYGADCISYYNKYDIEMIKTISHN